MRRASQAVIESCYESLQACSDLICSLRSVQGLMGKPGQRRSYKHLKSMGTAMILAPTPEPFTDLIGLALISVGAAAEKRKTPLTISEMSEEGRSILKGIGSSLPASGRSWF